MNDSAPPSPPTTAGQRRPTDPLGLEQRRELQRRWEQARELMRQRPYDHDRVHALLVDCVVQDPASPLYVDALLQNLSGKSQSKRRRPWLRGWRRRRALRDAWRAAKWDEVLRTGPDLLGGDPWNSALLLPLIDACLATDCRDSAWRYVQHALVAHPEDAALHRRAGRLLMRLARFDEARAQWREVARFSPNDHDAMRFLAVLPATPGEGDVPPRDVTRLMELIPTLLAERRLDAAERLLQSVAATATHDLRWKHWFEELTLARHRAQLTIAESLAACDTDSAWQALVGELRHSLHRVEVEVFDARCRRYPADAGLRLEVGRRLRWLGNPAEAARYFREAADDQRWRTEALLEEGECWQSLRQFARALECYRSAVERPTSTAVPDEHRQRALYRTAVLADALGERILARECLEKLVEQTPNFRDAADRLDKLRRIDHKSGSAPG